MKKFIVSAVWLIAVVPFYALFLLCIAWSALVLYILGRLFNDTEPYEWIDKMTSIYITK